MFVLVVFVSLFSLVSSAGTGLTGNYFNNSAFGGNPSMTSVDSTVNFTWSDGHPLPAPFTVRWKGTLTFPRDDLVEFLLVADGGVRLWICDHLLIDAWNTATSPQNLKPIASLPVKKSKPCLVHLEYAHYGGDPIVRLMWQGNFSSNASIIPADYLQPNVSAAEMQRQEIRDKQRNLGWGTWSNQNMLSHVLMPHSFAVDFQLYAGTSAALPTVAVFRKMNPALVRPVAHSWPDDAPTMQYTELSVSNWSALHGNVTVQSAQDVDGNVVVLITSTSEISIGMYPHMLWGRVGNIAMNEAGEISADMPGLSSVSFYPTINPSSVDTKKMMANFSMKSGPLGFSAGVKYTVSQIQSVISTGKSNHEKIKLKYGTLSEIYNAMQTVIAWNTIYDPHEGIVMPVSRTWNFGAGYVIFDWDNYFVSYMTALDKCDLAASSLVQVTKAKTIDGFVPNFASGTRKSRDRTEPPIGAKVTWEIYKKCQNRWLVELLYEDLLDWNTWFWTKRRLDPLGIICLGSDPNQPGSGENNLQDARFESGLDNSPMYDSPPVEYNSTSHKMQLYDVGMTSMFLMETKHLVMMAQLLGFHDDVAMLQDRFDAMSALAMKNLWNATAGTFQNKINTNNEFYSRLSPTVFYPMLAHLPTNDQVKDMMTKHLGMPGEFCVNMNPNDYESLGSMTALIQVEETHNRHDSCLCGSVRCSTDQLSAKYAFTRYEGLVYQYPAVTDLIPLNLFYSSSNQDNLVTTSSTWNDSSYGFIQVQGYCVKNGSSSSTTNGATAQVDLWWNADSKDHMTCVSDACRQAAKTANYTFVRDECLAWKSPSCVYALPSISRDDGAFGDNSYWRGRIWGPMVQLVYWGLQEYAGAVPAVDAARKALCAQSRTLLMKEWLENNHVHENYNSVYGVGGDVGNSDPFYHWGALTGFISLLEEGYW